MHLLVIRHARSTANVDGILAGRQEGIHLDDHGRQQAEALVERLGSLEISGVIGSPLTRCKETAEALCIQRRIPYLVDERLNEVDYGTWSGRALKELGDEPLWSEIQNSPTSVTFPAGESLHNVFNRASDFLASMATRTEDEVVLAFTHGDVAKALISVALAAPANEFQRIVVDPASITLMRVTSTRSFVLRINESTTTVQEMIGKTSNQGVVGGGR